MRELKKSDLLIGDILIYEDFDFDEIELIKKMDEAAKHEESYSKKIEVAASAAFNYLLHYLIAWFDPGKEGEDYKNIYHAGIWGNVNINRDKKGSNEIFKNGVVEATGSGIQFSTLKENLTDDAVKTIYVCRLKNKKDCRASNYPPLNSFKPSRISVCASVSLPSLATIRATAPLACACA